MNQKRVFAVIALAVIAIAVTIFALGGYRSAPVAVPSPTPTSLSAPTPTTQPPPFSGGNASKGKKVFSAIGCIGCHTIQGVGGKVGPDLSNVGARRDEAYILQSVLEPQAYIVPGYPPLMPSPDELGLSDQDIANLVAYLTSLR